MKLLQKLWWRKQTSGTWRCRTGFIQHQRGLSGVTSRLPPSPTLLFPPAPPNPWLRPRQKQWASKITEAEVVSGEQKLFKQDNRQKAESCYSQWGLVFQLRVPTSNQVRKRKASIIY